jgi:hypothetical protein
MASTLVHAGNGWDDSMAERVGFEPTVRDFRLRWAPLAPPKMPPHANSEAILNEPTRSRALELISIIPYLKSYRQGLNLWFSSELKECHIIHRSLFRIG